MLIPNHYMILSETPQDGGAVYGVRLLPDCPVYAGHFPGSPVSPGVCTIQMVRELAERCMGRRLLLRTIRQCRMTALLLPDGEALEVSLRLADGCLTATVCRGEQTCLTLKADVE